MTGWTKKRWLQNPPSQNKSKSQCKEDARDSTEDEAQQQRWQRAGVAVVRAGKSKPV